MATLKYTLIQRQAAIRELLRKETSLGIPGLAEQFGVSEMTVRRDLDRLEEGGKVRRTHGGAVVSERMAFEFDFAARRRAHQAQKQAIAKRAVALVRPGQRLIIDSGTTGLELACRLTAFDRLTVITPSLAVASALQFAKGVETVLLGGIVRRGSPDLTGIVTETLLDLFAVDIAFQGADAIGNDGAMYTGDLRVANVDRAIRNRADRTFILADSSKIGRTALYRHGFVYEADGWITDAGISRTNRMAFQKMGATLMVAQEDI
jgi:DeoR/GlpR family transcriptional regulator of sugar metabolism